MANNGLTSVKVKVQKKGRNVKGQFIECELFGVPVLDETGLLDEMTYPDAYLATVTEPAIRAELKVRGVKTDTRVMLLEELNKHIRFSHTMAGITSGIREFLKVRFLTATDVQMDNAIQSIYRAMTGSQRNFQEVWNGYEGQPVGFKALAPMLLGPMTESK